MAAATPRSSYWIPLSLLLVAGCIAVMWIFSAGRRDRIVIQQFEDLGERASTITALPYALETFCPRFIRPWFDRVYAVELYTGTDGIPGNYSGLRHLTEVSIWAEDFRLKGDIDFSGCVLLKSVYIGDIDQPVRSFKNCGSLHSITLNGVDEVMQLPDFSGCESLKKLSILCGKSAVDQRLNLPQLEGLSLWLGEGTGFPDFKSCTKLKLLQLSARNDVAVPDLSQWKDTLLSLELTGENLTFPEGLFPESGKPTNAISLSEFHKLERLELTSIVAPLPPLDGMKNLRALTLADLAQLETLTLLQNGIEELELGELPNLRTIPPLPSLQTVSFSDLPLEPMDQWAKEGQTIKELRLFGPIAEEGGREPGFLKRLTVTQTVRIHGLALSEEACKTLLAPSLTHLNLWYVEIDALPDLSGFALKEFALEHSPIRRLESHHFPKTLETVTLSGLKYIDQLPPFDLPNGDILSINELPIEEAPKILSKGRLELVIENCPLMKP